MGFLKQAKEAAQQAQQAFAPPQGDGPVHVQGAWRNDRSVLHGRAVGWNPADTKAALDGWVQRMGQSMAVGQQFRKFMGY